MSKDMFNTNLTAINIEYDTPIKTGRRFKVGNAWKDEYIYYKNIGALPNTTIVIHETSINKSDVTMVTGTGGTAVKTDGGVLIFNACRPLDANGAVSCISSWNNDKFAFQVEAGNDRRSATGHCWVTYY